MKKIFDGFFSMLFSVILLCVFAISIGYATFFENERGTELAREMIYGSRWFECLLVLLVVNLIGSIFRYKLLRRRKWSVLLFHLAFVCMILGAAVTRYFGFEGLMHIRQGESSNEISSDRTSVTVSVEQGSYKLEKSFDASFSPDGKNHFSETLRVDGREITVEEEQFLPNSIETIVPDKEGGPALSLLVMDAMNRVSEFILLPGETSTIEGRTFGFMSMKPVDLLFSLKDDALLFRSNFPMMTSGMTDQTHASLLPGEWNPAERKIMYRSEHFLFVLKAFLPNARKNLIPATQGEATSSGVEIAGKNALVFRVSDGQHTRRVNVLTDAEGVSLPSICDLGDARISLSYGKLPRKLPFSIRLEKFEIDRYPGSNSPSSYASEIVLTDAERQTRTPFRIYMNNILKYRGYRFFQSSYDQDERGTILSVSHDFWGTFISYAGYLFMLLGMVLTLFNKNSRFRTLMQLSGEVQKKRKSAKTLLLLFLLGVSAGAQASDDYVSQKDHLSQLEELLIQDGVQGRIEPLNTYSSDLLRKIAKETSYGKTSATAVFLGMCTDSEHWKNEPIIKVSDPKLGKELGAVNGYVTFNQMFDFDNEGQYRLSELVEKTYQKAPAMRNKYDKEVINVDERVNICYEVFTGNLLNLFPDPGGKDKKWRTASTIGMVDASTSGCPMHSMTGDSTTQTSPTIQKSGPNETACLLDAYFRAVLEAQKSGNWKHAVDCLSGIKDYQFKNGGELLPSMSKIRLEILYNNLNLFGKLAILYALLGFLLLVLHLVNIFRFEGSLDRFLKKCTYLFILVFAVYSLGLGIRWYVSGHAPWSNGYETIVFVGWATGLSGLAFVRRSPITLAVTSLLSAIALFVAGMSWMNPEITNLVPVLKSYWLVLHVAVITSSYGFFAMAALMGLLNLFLMMSRSKKNVTRLNESVREFSYIIEMALYIGLVMLSVGTFLGAVWANESWGRYWGWDPKETWALVSILVYAIVLHLRKVPALNNQLVLSTMALLSFSTVLMTFFGVNYYLSGMHSYAQGTPPTIPAALYIVLIGVLVVIVLAIRSQRIVQGWDKESKK